MQTFGADRYHLALILSLLLASCGGGGGDSAQSTAPMSASSASSVVPNTVGPSGGMIVSADSHASVVIPPNALGANTVIQASGNVNEATADTVGSYVVSLTPDGTAFSTPARLSVTIDPQWLPDDWSASGLELAYLGPDGWVSVPTTPNLATSTLDAQISHFSQWAVVPRGRPNSSPDYTWEINGQCLRTTNAAYNALLDSLSTVLFSSPPSSTSGCVSGAYLESGYSRFFPSNQNHAGIDFLAGRGTAVYSPIAGVVTYEQLEPNSQSPAKGKSTLTIEGSVSGTTYEVLLLHCQSHALVRNGSTIKDPITVGTPIQKNDRVCLTGRVGAAGPHLHVEVKRLGQDLGNLLAMSGARGACATSSFLGGWNENTQKYDLPLTKPGCSLADIRANTVDPTTLVLAPAAPVVTLAANPTTVVAGGSSQLTWTSINATACTASGDWNGSKNVSGTQSTGALTSAKNFLLTCTGAGGSASATAAVTVSSPPPLVTLNANPTTVVSGSGSQLTWSSSNATSCLASGGWSGSKGTAGTEATSALLATTNFVLTCTGAGGSSPANTFVTVTSPQPTVNLTASPTTVASGGSSQLIWSSTNATSCAAGGGWTGTKNITGTQATGALTVATTFTLTCTGAGGSATASAPVAVNATLPTVTLSASPTSVTSGSSGQLTWSSSNATSCTASGGWSGIRPVSGTQSTGALTATTNYALTCIGAGGSATANTAVTVNVVAPIVTGVSPTSMLASSQTQTLTINGSGFVVGDFVELTYSGGSGAGIWSGIGLGIISINPTQIVLTMNPGTAADTIYVRVCRSVNPTPSGCSAGTASVTVYTATTYQPGNDVGVQDIWTTSVFSYTGAGGGPGGGLNNDMLRVGGWGDLYYGLIQFELSMLPANAASTRLELFMPAVTGAGTTQLFLDRITTSWDWRTQGTGSDRLRLWWADQPAATPWTAAALPAPVAGQWYSIDITTLYNAWKSGSVPNFGVRLRPSSGGNNTWAEFASSNNADATIRPRLVITPGP